jgi:DMSO/TMAO reductase YedYZ molybdopterin-dependent catalytic subunit
MISLLKRRTFLRSAAGLPIVAGLIPRWLSAADIAAPAARAGDLLVREASPVNLEMPLTGFKNYITPNDLFYVRNHFDAPKIDVGNWKLTVEGHVEKPFSLSYDDLQKIKAKSVTALLECSGNGRSLLDPKKKGVQWNLGAVGNAKWTGVTVDEILRQAGIRSGAVDVVFVGADRGDGKDGEKLQFLRSVPIEKARDPKVLLAHQMNDRTLPAQHGFPLRVIVPGWYGVASVKWLERIIVTDERFNGYFQSIDYSYWERVSGAARMTPITTLQVKSIIASPAIGETLEPNKQATIQGAAWSDDATIAKVEISTDGGKHWQPAKLLDEPVQYSWRRWEFAWRTPSAPGPVSILAKATDSAGATQPTERDQDRRNYMINHVVPWEVKIR